MRVAVFCCLYALLAGCGQRGDLYLPDEPRAEAGEPPPAAAAEEAKKKK